VNISVPCAPQCALGCLLHCTGLHEAAKPTCIDDFLSVCLLQCVSFAGTLHCLFDHHEHQGYCASYISTRRSIVLPNSVVFRLLANLREAVKFSYSTCDACVKCQLALRRPVASIRDIKTENCVGDFMRHLTYCLNASVSVLSMLHFVKTCTVYRN